MPDSMYDRLGSMLSDVLESGSFFADTKKDTNEQTKKNNADEHGYARMNTDDGIRSGAERLDEEEKVTERAENSKKDYKDVGKNRLSQKRAGVVYKAVSVEVKKALTLLGLDENATLDEAKKAYHEKLKYYHPDRHGTNPVLQKVAREKTRQVIEAWNVINAELGKRNAE